LALKVNFINLSHFYEEILGKVPVDLINKTWFLENLTEGNKTHFDLVKRIFEFFLSAIILIVTLPFWLLISVLIKISSKGPVFFEQERIGQNDMKFKMIKFRTMRMDSNDFRPTEENDERITKVGLFLRRTRIDELPQMINILRGEMSFIGPRPERPELVSELEHRIPFYNERMLVKPGLTGWDQVSNEYHSPSYEDTIEKLQYDLFYVKNRSFYLDVSIFLKTISTVLSRSGR
jgi:lipopolysaccharide/colanic/teichoic acid biosynthesis glycosyltransferase